MTPTIIKAWRQAHGERNLGNEAAATNAEEVAKRLEANLGLAVWHLDRRRRSWVPSLWRRAASQYGVLVLVDEDARLVLLGTEAGLKSTRDHAGNLENTLSKHDDDAAWGTIASMPAPAPSHGQCEADYLPWAQSRLDCDVDRAPTKEVE